LFQCARNQLALPAAQRPRNPLAMRAPPEPVEVDRTPVSWTLRELGPLVFRSVRGERPVGLFAWSSAARHLGPRDRYPRVVPTRGYAGGGKDDLTHRPNRTLKDVLGFPLVANFRERLLA
jgi:hypothetical protein